jgi:hypothetical protein
MRRVMERARFIAEMSIAEGLHIAILHGPRGAGVFAWAPTTPTSEMQLFKRAVYQNIRTVALYAARPWGRA